MKVNELMIGDWIKITRRKKIGRVYRIDMANGEGNGWAAVIDGDYHESDLEPIPLTPEILEKNGFIKDAGKDNRLTDVYHLLVPTGFERKSFTIQVSLYREPIGDVSTLVKCWGWLPPYNGGMNDIHLCSANYVHQLQHALRLCGIDKEIEV